MENFGWIGWRGVGGGQSPDEVVEDFGGVGVGLDEEAEEVESFEAVAGNPLEEGVGKEIGGLEGGLGGVGGEAMGKA